MTGSGTSPWIIHEAHRCKSECGHIAVNATKEMFTTEAHPRPNGRYSRILGVEDGVDTGSSFRRRRQAVARRHRVRKST